MVAAVDVVAIFDSSSRQVLSGARPVKATIKETARVMEHPVESGNSIVDHRIIMPVEIDLSMILTPETYKDTYIQLRQLFLNASLLTIQTRTGRYTRMLIEAIPHEENPELYDTIAIAFSLREALLVRARFGTLPPGTVSNPADTSTQDTGQKQPRAQSAARDLIGRIFG